MIIEKHTQQTDLTKSKFKTEIVYTIKPEDQAEDLKINNFINSQKIPKTTLEDFQKEKSVEWTNMMNKEIIETIKTKPIPTPLKDAMEKAAKQNAEKEEALLKSLEKALEEMMGYKFPKIRGMHLCNCRNCRAERGEL